MTATQHDTLAPNDPQQHAYSKRQVCAMLGIYLNTLNRWIDRGVVPSFKLGKRVFIPRAGLEELMRPRVPAPARRPTLTTSEAWEADHPRPV